MPITFRHSGSGALGGFTQLNPYPGLKKSPVSLCFDGNPQQAPGEDVPLLNLYARAPPTTVRVVTEDDTAESSRGRF